MPQRGRGGRALGWGLGPAAAALSLGLWAAETGVSVGGAEVTEGDGADTVLEFPVTRTGPLGSNLVIEYNTAPGPMQPATAGADYVEHPPGSLLRIPAGSGAGTIQVTVSGDTVPEADEQVLLQLTRAMAFASPPDFPVVPSFAAGNAPHGVAVGDIDGDGRPDLVTADQDDGTVSVLRNTATGSAPAFAGRVSFAVGASPRAAAIADLDGDGRPDLAVANYDSHTVSVLISTSSAGAPSFSSPVNLAVTRPYALTTVDVDGDGRSDIVAASRTSASVAVLRNLSTPGAPAFAAAAYFLSGSGPAAVAAGDVDGDGRSDLVVAHYDGASMAVLRNLSSPGTVAFATAVAFATGAYPQSLALNDADGDGKLDVAVANSASDSVFLLRNTSSAGAPSFAAPLDVPAGTGPFAVRLDDWDGDGKPDLAVANNATNTVWFMRGTSSPGAPSFAAPLSFGVGAAPFALASGDLNADGRADLVVANFGGASVSVLRNTSASSGISMAGLQKFAVGTHPRAAAAADFDGDGRVDLAVANSSANSVTVLRNVGAAGAPDFAPAVTLAAGPAPLSVAARDLDGDGKPDLAVANVNGNSVSVWRNIATPGVLDGGSFAAGVPLAVGTNPYALAVADIDGDGKPDLATANYGSSNVSVRRNVATPGVLDGGSFAPAASFTTGSNPIGIALGDVDGDGKPDLVTANYTGNDVSVRRNTATSGAIDAASFAAQVTALVGSFPFAVAIGDLDGDGAPDLAVANSSGNAVSVLRNTGSPGAPALAAAVALTVGAQPYGVAIRDLDGDGRPEIASADYGASTVSILRNVSVPGSLDAGSFAAAATLAPGSNPVALLLEDLDADGKPDLLAVNTGSHDVAITRNSGGLAVTLLDTEAVGTIRDEDDDVPDAFAFAPEEGVPRGSVRESNAITVAGTNTAAAVTVSTGEYSKNGGEYTSAGGTAVAGDTFKVRHTSASGFEAVTSTTLVIGGEGATFTSTTEAADITPEPFDLGGPDTGVALGALQVSAEAVIAGLNTAAPIAVTGGFYAVNGGSCTNAAGTVAPGDAVKVCHAAAATYSTQTDTTLTIGADGVLAGVSATYSSVTRSSAGLDTTPLAFTFTARTGVALETALVSNAVTVSGISAPAPIAVSGAGSSAYSIGCNGAFTSSAGTIAAGQRVCVRHVSAGTAATRTDTVLTIGGASGAISATFSSTTVSVADATPGAFSFASRTGVPLGALVTSKPVVPKYYNTGAAVGVSGGSYSIGCTGTFTAAPGVLFPQQSVCVRHVAAATPGTAVGTTLTVGGVAATFTSTTVGAADAVPDAFRFADRSAVSLDTVIQSNVIAIAGLNTAATIALGPGSDASSEYSVGCDGAFTSEPGTIAPAQKVCVRHRSSASLATATQTVLVVGGVSDTFTSTTVATADTTPAAFKFADRTGVGYGVPATSAPLAISGINTATPIALGPGSDASSEYSVGCTAEFTSSPSLILPAQVFCVRHTSAAVAGGVTHTVLDIGGVTDTFTTTTTTAAIDDVPYAFKFKDRTGVAHAVVLTSNVITVTGINVPVPISITGGEYSIGCKSGFTAAAGSVSSGQKVCVRHTTAATSSTYRDTVLTIGPLADTFTSVTTSKPPGTGALP
jgi:hypothetical protein